MILNVLNMKLIYIILLALIMYIGPDFGYASEAKYYPKTIQVLSNLYANGLISWQRYKSFEAQAQVEGYQGLASMFSAMAASQSVMTERFGRLLVELGGHRPMCFLHPTKVTETKANLKMAIEMEFLETDVTLPKALRQLAGEGYAKAVRSLQLVLDAQRHQRKILQKIYPYTGLFFGAFTSKIEKVKPTYYICRQTGTVIVDALPVNCPVQGGSTTAYIRLFHFETPDMINTCPWKDRFKFSG